METEKVLKTGDETSWGSGEGGPGLYRPEKRSVKIAESLMKVSPRKWAMNIIASNTWVIIWLFVQYCEL